MGLIYDSFKMAVICNDAVTKLSYLRKLISPECMECGVQILSFSDLWGNKRESLSLGDLETNIQIFKLYEFPRYVWDCTSSFIWTRFEGLLRTQ